MHPYLAYVGFPDAELLEPLEMLEDGRYGERVPDAVVGGRDVQDLGGGVHLGGGDGVAHSALGAQDFAAASLGHFAAADGRAQGVAGGAQPEEYEAR